ncbi:P pilus assembly chaperone PapD [Gillisia sp. Hel_I_86]|uniref:molecular chaperone n=1 Tax=Gillisia sp. Hel_I_86 TaxID=1249981 RepID=UPI001198E494|nr:molecular chaperone [Gillisia sp. Hel_I_86]TVZ28394.1 P pilus assembly chaperone PapD [Gillisia sp. Hel_I_86]
MKQNSKSPFLFVLVTCIIFTSSFTFAQGDLMVIPKRLVFAGSERSQEINLINTGADTATYAISFIQYKMNEDGSFDEIENPEEGQNFANEFLRYYPRRVNLAPNEAQTIRVQITKRNLLNPGEYRSHMYFRAVEEVTALEESDIEDEEDAISINIKTVFGISIPIIIRNGASTTKLELKDFNLIQDDNKTKLSIEFNRNGNFSTYGDLSVEYIPEVGESYKITAVRGLAVYTPNNKRKFVLNLPEMEGVDYSKGKLKISYKTAEGKIYDEYLYDLN